MPKGFGKITIFFCSCVKSKSNICRSVATLVRVDFSSSVGSLIGNYTGNCPRPYCSNWFKDGYESNRFCAIELERVVQNNTVHLRF